MKLLFEFQYNNDRIALYREENEWSGTEYSIITEIDGQVTYKLYMNKENAYYEYKKLITFLIFGKKV